MEGWKHFKEVLADKLADEGTYFTPSYIIRDKSRKDGFSFHIKDYEHIVYTVTIKEETDISYAEHCGKYWANVSTNERECVWCDWTNEPQKALERIARNIGYIIGNTY